MYITKEMIQEVANLSIPIIVGGGGKKRKSYLKTKPLSLPKRW